MRESLVKAVIFWLVVCFTIWGVWLTGESILLTIVAGAVLLASLTSFYFPTRYRIDANGASWQRMTGGKSIDWTRVRRVVVEQDGVFLSPFAGRTMMENFRGIYLPFRSNRDELLEIIRLYAINAGDLPATPSDNRPSGESARNYFGHRK